MKVFIYRSFYTFLALSMVFFVYSINKRITLLTIANKLEMSDSCISITDQIPDLLSYFLYFIVLFILTSILLYFSKHLPSFDVTQGSIKTIEPANEGLIITYFGVFFFALSVSNYIALILAFILLFICIMFSNVYMFNPLLSLLRYKFYYITFNSGKKCMLMSKEDFAYGDDVKLERVYKLNEFTYIDISKEPTDNS